MRPPEDYYWNWLAGGFKGLFSMILKTEAFGHRPPTDFVNQMRTVHEQIGEFIKKYS